MKLIRLTGLSLVVAFALGAIAAASASAKEVLYELSKGSFPATFTSTGGASKLETVTGGLTGVVSCTGLSDKGHIGSATEGSGKTAHLGEVEIAFTGCTAVGGAVKCTTSGAKEGEILVPSGVWHLGLADPGDHPAQLLLISGVEFKCLTETVKVSGSIIGTLKNSAGNEAEVGEEAEEAKLVFEQSKGKQKYTEFLLSLTTPENELMTGQHLTTTKGTKAEESGQETPSDTISGFKNSAGESVKVKLIEG